MYESINQAVQPHVIIVLNAVDISISKQDWNPQLSTKKHLDALEVSFKNDPQLTSIIEALGQSVASTLHTVADLLRHFYASVTVINLPSRAHHMRMDSQVRELYDSIKKRSWESYEIKRSARVLLKAERLERVVASVFNHFSQNLDSPFDFLSQAMQQNPIPSTLGDNILRFILAFQRSAQDNHIKHDARRLLLALVPVLASSIMLDAERSDISGGSWFPCSACDIPPAFSRYIGSRAR